MPAEARIAAAATAAVTFFRAGVGLAAAPCAPARPEGIMIIIMMMQFKGKSLSLFHLDLCFWTISIYINSLAVI